MATLDGTMKVSGGFGQPSASLPGSPRIAASPQMQLSLQGNGTGQDQADLKHTKQYTLAATPLALDLTALADIDGVAQNFKRVRSFLVTIVDVASGHTVLFGYATTTANAWTSLLSNPGQFTIRPSTSVNQGGLAIFSPDATGYAVGASNKLVQFDPGANTVVISVEILGASV